LYIFGGVIPSHLDSDDSTSIRSNALHKVIPILFIFYASKFTVVIGF